MALIGASPIRTSSLVVHLILRHATTPNVLPSLSRAAHIALYKTREILIIDNDLTHIIVKLRELTLTLMEVSAETEASSASFISEHITVILSMNGPFLDIGNIFRLFHRWLAGLDVWLVRVCKLVELFRLRSVLAELLCHLQVFVDLLVFLSFDVLLLGSCSILTSLGVELSTVALIVVLYYFELPRV